MGIKLKDSAGTRTNGYALAMNKCRLEIKRMFLEIVGMETGTAGEREGKENSTTVRRISISLEKGG